MINNDKLIPMGVIQCDGVVRNYYIDKETTMWTLHLEGDEWLNEWTVDDLHAKLVGWVNSKRPLEWDSVIQVRQLHNGTFSVERVWMTKDPCGLMAWSKFADDKAERFVVSIKHTNWKLPYFQGERTYFPDTSEIHDALREIANFQALLRDMLVLEHPEAVKDLLFVAKELHTMKLTTYAEEKLGESM